jgi:hypothetical protein
MAQRRKTCKTNGSVTLQPETQKEKKKQKIHLAR